MITLHQLETRLLQKSTSELLKFFQSFQLAIKKAPYKNGGQGQFRSLQRHVGVSDNKMEQYGTLLKTAKENIDGLRTGRFPVYKIYAENTDGYFGKDPDEKYEFAMAKARRYMIDGYLTIIRHLELNVDADTGAIIAKGPGVLLFNVYYWYEQSPKEPGRIGTGQLKIACDDPDSPNYTLGSSSLRLHRSDQGMIAGSSSSSSSVTKTPIGMVSITLEDVLGTGDQVAVMFHAGRHSPAHWKYLTGIYATVGPGHENNVVTGLVILQMTPGLDFSGDGEFITPLPIANYLHRTRFFATPPAFEHPDKLPSAAETKFIEPLAGKYSGIYQTDTKDVQKIEKLLMIIDADGRVAFYPSELGQPYYGQLSMLGFNRDTAVIALDPDREGRAIRMVFYLHTGFGGNGKNILKATYAGIDSETPYMPVAGPVVFQKILNGSNHPSAATNLPEDTVGFDEMLPHLNINRKQSLPQSSNGFNTALSGTYYIYFLSTKQANVYKVPISINSKGEAVLRTRDNGSVHHGMAVHNGSNRLSIIFRHGSDNDSFFHILFSTGNTSNVKAGDYFFGISSKFDSQNRPSGRMEILVRIDFNFERSLSDTFPVNTPKFQTENESTNGILNYLLGRSNRIVVSKRTSGGEFKRKTGHPEFFYAACYRTKTARDDEDREAGLKLLYQAYLHGYGTDMREADLIRKEMADSFSEVLESRLRSRPDHSDLASATFRELLEMMLTFAS